MKKNTWKINKKYKGNGKILMNILLIKSIWYIRGAIKCT